MKERCLVDDMLVAVASEASIPPLLDTLDRFEAMSHHAMQIQKTVLLLLGDSRNFNVHGPTEAALRLRARGLATAHDISGAGARQLPAKWHGVILANDLALSNAWESTAAATKAHARSLQACALPNGCQGRQNLARGQLMGKVQAALKFQAPNDDSVVEDTLRTIQTAADHLVFGRRCFLTMDTAKQPKSSMGVGHLDVARHMRAVWLQPLLAAAGANPATRPFRHFYAQLARRAYPELDAGAELLTLNLGFHAVLALPTEAILGETRQAFKALAALPPLQYCEPSEDSAAQPREEMQRDELLDQLLFHNPRPRPQASLLPSHATARGRHAPLGCERAASRTRRPRRHGHAAAAVRRAAPTAPWHQHIRPPSWTRPPDASRPCHQAQALGRNGSLPTACCAR